MSDTLQPPAGASAWELAMIDYLTTHARIEGKLLDGYVQAAESTNSKAFAYLVGLLAEDERRHHRQFLELAKSLAADAELSGADPVIPRLDFGRVDRNATLELTRQLIANEENDASELKRLRKELHDFVDTTMWSLIVETMQMDTAKHLAILRFAEKHCQ